MIIKAIYTSVFDDSIVCESNCKYDTETKIAFDFDDAENSDKADNTNALTDEYITVDGVQLRDIEFDY